MARRADPRQGDFFVADAGTGYMAPKDALSAELLMHLQDALPKGVPIAVAEVLSVTREPSGALVGRVRVFDGEVQTVRVRGTRDTLREYSWPDLRAPFGWDKKAKAWRRYPKAAEPAVPEPSPPQEPDQDTDLATLVMTEARKRLPADAWDPYVRVIEVRQEEDGIYAAIECTDGLQKHVVVRGEPGAYLVMGLTVDGHPPMMWRTGTKVWERLK